MNPMRSVICVALLALAGCSALVPKLQAPRLTIVNVEILKSDLLQQQLRVRMRVQNPNDRALPIRSITYSIEVAGEEFAHGDSDRNFIVPALGETEFDVNVTANAMSLLLRMAGGGARSRELDYRLVGKVSLSSGLLRTIPFEQKGVVPLK
jgi:LEA14-like dessication related protein